MAAGSLQALGSDGGVTTLWSWPKFLLLASLSPYHGASFVVALLSTRFSINPDCCGSMHLVVKQRVAANWNPYLLALCALEVACGLVTRNGCGHHCA